MKNVTKISESTNKKVVIYVDTKEANHILPYLFKDKNTDTYKRFLALVYENRRNSELYRKEDISGQHKNTYSIRFTSGKNQNDRIYCLEKHDGKRNIILVKLHENKRSQHVNKQIKSILKTLSIKNYE